MRWLFGDFDFVPDVLATGTLDFLVRWVDFKVAQRGFSTFPVE